MMNAHPPSSGRVYLIGAGPGDPGLLTLRARDRLARADVVVYDRLVNPAILQHISAGAEQIYAGKSPAGHTLTQDEINALLVAKALEGKTVARLKGGDPFVFGRGGEEAEALVAAGIPFEVVPGITSAVAVPAFAGIPVTHRNVASSFAVVTGHEDPTREESRLDWAALSKIDTLILLMGVENLPSITEELIRHGRTASTPAAVIRWGTWPRQQTVTGTLADIVQRAREAGITAPAVTVVGDVVGLRDRLRWFDNRPLSGKRVLVTRSRQQASALVQLLAEYGADPVELPAIAIEPLSDHEALDGALRRLEEYDWVVFTSVNGAAATWERLAAQGKDARAFGRARICAIGPATAAALAEHGLNADLVPDEYVAESVVAAMARTPLQGARVLIPRAEEARAVIVDGLSALGAHVDEVPAYRTVQDTGEASDALRLLEQGAIDVVTFTSSSTVRNLLGRLNGNADLLRNITIAAIGPVTARTAEEASLNVDVVAQEHTIPGLVNAIVEHFKERT